MNIFLKEDILKNVGKQTVDGLFDTISFQVSGANQSINSVW